MNSEPMCVPCVIKQSERLVKVLTANNDDCKTDEMLSKIRHHALDIAAELSLDDPPSKYTSVVLDKVYDLLGIDDPYLKTKREQNEIGKKLSEYFNKELHRSTDPIHDAIKIAALGNLIDVGPSVIYTLLKPENSYADEIKAMLQIPLKIDDYKVFKEKLRSAKSILYILDNSGEIYFDKLLIERLKGIEITIAVKARPILNDATITDARESGLDNFGNIITVNKLNHYRHLGVDFECVSDEFRYAFDNADIVIAKGHANFESLVDNERDCFFILMAKCPVVARKLNVAIKDRVFYYSPNQGD